MKVISVKSWDGTEFFYDQQHSKYVQYEMADLTSMNFCCDESDLETAKEIAIEEELTSHEPILEELPEDAF